MANPSDALLAAYALAQLAKAVQDGLAQQEGLTEAELKAAYDRQGEALQQAIARWQSLHTAAGDIVEQLNSQLEAIISPSADG